MRSNIPMSPTLLAALAVTAMAGSEGLGLEELEAQLAGENGEDEDEEEEKGWEVDDQGRVKVEVSTGSKENKKTATFFTTIPQSLTEAAGESYLNGEEKVLKEIQKAWITRKKNAVRPGLADAIKNNIDINGYAQSTSDNYKPGRRGGFVPTMNADAIRNAGSVEDVLKMLREAGVQLV